MLRGRLPRRRLSLRTRYAPDAVSTLPVHFLLNPRLMRSIAHLPKRSQKVQRPTFTSKCPDSCSFTEGGSPAEGGAVGSGCLPMILRRIGPVESPAEPCTVVGALASSTTGSSVRLHGLDPAASISRMVWQKKADGSCRTPGEPTILAPTSWNQRQWRSPSLCSPTVEASWDRTLPQV